MEIALYKIQKGGEIIVDKFNECDEKAQEIMRFMEMVLVGLTQNYEVSLKDPAHDVARRFLNEIYEFEVLMEVL